MDSARNIVLGIGLVCVVILPLPIPYAEWRWIDGVLWVCLAFYALEWALHLLDWSRSPNFGDRLTSFQNLADAMAVLPILAAHALGFPATTAWLLGAFWLLKLPAATSGFSLLGRAFMAEAKPITSVIKVFVFVLVMAAIAMHLVEREAQPAAFGTLPNALYWAVTTLTTTGYGDIVPVTPLGRLIAGFVMISGLAVFGLWTGILATGFAAETRRRDFVRTWEFVAKVPFFEPLSPAAIIEIARMLRTIDVAERTVIVRKGRQGDCMYFIAEGLVEVVGCRGPARPGRLLWRDGPVGRRHPDRHGDGGRSHHLAGPRIDRLSDFCRPLSRSGARRRRGGGPPPGGTEQETGARS